MTEIAELIREQLMGSESVISDDAFSVRYRELEQQLPKSGPKKTAFNILPLRNKLSRVTQLISYLTNGQNFLVLKDASNDSYTKESITTFCENLVHFQDTEDLTLAGIDKNHTIYPNPFFRRDDLQLDRHKSFFILKTSGTTNQPKFVIHDQALALRNSNRCKERLDLAMNDRVLVPVSVHHSYGLVTALVPSLIAGSSIRLIENTNIIKLIDAIKVFEPNVLFATPGLIEMLLRVKSKFGIPKITITAGDKIRQDLYLKYESQIGPILNLYGSTEMGAMAMSDLKQDASHRSEGGLTGLSGMEFKLKEDSEKLCTILCKSDSRFFAYLNYEGHRLDENSETEDWFDTKDIGRIDNNELKVFGRADHKVNRNGVLISFFEIESAIELACQELRKVIVIRLNKRDIMGDQFAAICELKDNVFMDEEEIRRQCVRNIDKPLVPAVIVVTTAMPLLPNGKVDRNLLKKEYGSIATASER